jgi:hypothetical protein
VLARLAFATATAPTPADICNPLHIDTDVSKAENPVTYRFFKARVWQHPPLGNSFKSS